AAPARFALFELGLELAEEAVVRVDVLDVVDLDAGFVFELGDCAVLAGVDVAGPVRDRQLAARRAALRRRRFVAVAAADRAAAAGRQAQRHDDEGDGGGERQSPPVLMPSSVLHLTHLFSVAPALRPLSSRFPAHSNSGPLQATPARRACARAPSSEPPARLPPAVAGARPRWRWGR